MDLFLSLARKRQDKLKQTIWLQDARSLLFNRTAPGFDPDLNPQEYAHTDTSLSGTTCLRFQTGNT